MSRRLLISALPGETRAAWREDGRLIDLAVRRDDKPSVADNLYLGRVRTVDKGLAAAFVDVGLRRPGFLPLGEAPKGLSEGDVVVVRVKREPSADKGARLSARLEALPPALAEAARRAAPPALLRAAADPVAAALAADRPPDEIAIDDPATFARARQAAAGRPDLLARLRLDLDPVPLFEREGVEAEIEALLEPRVALPSGGFLLIEPVRTLTAIDVDSGRHDAGGAAGQGLAVNLEAAAEIARQVRLRNLSGLLVVDFLTLDAPAARRRVVAALRQGLAADPQPCRVHPMRPSGLVEMTRRRGRPPLHELLSEPCGLGGGGRVKDPVTLAFEALRAARRIGAATGGALAIHAAPRVAEALEGPAAEARVALEARLGRPLVVRREGGREGFEIALVPTTTER
ncbi:MAG: ribonuclease E/G [Kiloniellaceae bacterium]